MLRLQQFVDPNFGSERYLEIDPMWVVEAKDTIIKVFPFQKHPATLILLQNGQRYRVHGHWSAQIQAARSQTNAQSEAEREHG